MAQKSGLVDNKKMSNTWCSAYCYKNEHSVTNRNAETCDDWLYWNRRHPELSGVNMFGKFVCSACLGIHAWAKEFMNDDGSWNFDRKEI